MAWLQVPTQLLSHKITVYELFTMLHNRKGKNKHVFSIFTNKTSLKKENISLNREQLIYPVKDKFEVCDYSHKFLILLGWIIYDIIMD